MRWITGVLGGATMVLAGLVGSDAAQAGPTLDAVKARGKIRCGIPTPSAGYAFPDSKGVVRGFDADVCRAISAAIFGDPEKIEFIPTTSQARFQALQSGEVDLLSRQTTVTYTRDNALGFNFAPTVFYDGQGLMVPKKLGVDSAKKLDGAAVCVQPGTTTELNLADYFRTNGMKFQAVVFESADEWRAAFFSGRCDVLTTDRSDLAATRAVANNPSDYIVLPETISKEPLAPLVRHADDQWFDIVKWTVYAQQAAEELGVTAANAAELAKSSTNPEVQRLLGTTDDLGSQMGLSKDWALNAIKAVGNYGEMFNRNLGPDTPLGLSRGPNELWTKGGLIYSPPFR